MKAYTAVIAASLLIGGCSAIQEAADFSIKSACDGALETVGDFLVENPNIDSKFRQAIIESRVENGMTKEMVAASWGSKADKIVITGNTKWQWESREPKGEWVEFSNSMVVNASTYKTMFYSNYASCTK